jgi:hypothetical protein
VKKSTGPRERLRVDGTGARVVSQAGGLRLARTAAAVGLDGGLSSALARWRKPTAVHDPGKVLLDLAVAVALGGDCLADIAVLREQPAVFGPVASDPTVSRLVDALAGDVDAAVAAIGRVRAAVRARAWTAAGPSAPDHGADSDRPLVLDVDATLVTSHSDKKLAAPTFKKGFGFHPLLVFADHGPAGTGEPLAGILRPGNAGSNTAADHIRVVWQALAQLPGHQAGRRPGRRILVRADGGGGTHEFLDWLTGRRLSYSIGFGLTGNLEPVLKKVPAKAWTPAYDSDGQVRPGAWVTEITDLLPLHGWPKGMRVIIRAERPHPGAQLRLTDVNGNRITAFVTNTARGQLADLELRHRRRARCEDRIRAGKATGLRNFPFHDFAQNRVWLAVITLAHELLAWTGLLALHGHDARRWEPKRLRLRLFTIAGTLARRSRQIWLRLSRTAPWTPLLLTGLKQIHAVATAIADTS